MHSHGSHSYLIWSRPQTISSNRIISQSCHSERICFLYILDIRKILSCPAEIHCLSHCNIYSISSTYYDLLFTNIRKIFREQIYPIYLPESWREWKEYFVLGIDGALMYVPRIWGFMLIAVQASYLGTLYVRGNAILQNTFYILFGASVGSNLSSSIMTGNALGYGSLQPLSTIKLASFTYSISIGLVLNGGLFMFQKDYFGIYISDMETLDLTLSVLPCLIIASMISQIFSVIEGVMRGCGEQKRPARSNYITYLLLLHPFAYVLGFTFQLRLIGLWVVWDVCLAVVLIWYIIHLFSLPMNDILQRVNQRVNTLHTPR